MYPLEALPYRGAILARHRRSPTKLTANTSYDTSRSEKTNFSNLVSKKVRFFVRFFRYSDGDGFLESEPTKDAQVSIAGLEPYTEYEFRVLTVGDVGRGKPSRPVEITTGEARKKEMFGIKR